MNIYLKISVILTGLWLSTPSNAMEKMMKVPEVMRSEKMEVHFDLQTQEPKELLNVETGERLVLQPESAFHFEMDKATVDARECNRVSVSQQGSKREVVYQSPRGRVTVQYGLGPQDHFLEKSVIFAPSFSEAYLLRDVCVQQFRFSEKPKELISFQHGRCLTHFVRQSKGGFFFGIQVPMEVPVDDPGGSIKLGYRANYRFPAGEEAYVAEKCFWGVYRRTGQLAPKVPEWFKLCRNSTIPPDLGESEAMLAMVLRLTKPAPRAVTCVLCGWQDQFTMKGFGVKAVPAEVERDKTRLLEAKEQFGEFDGQTATPWGGMAFDMPSVGPEDSKPPSSPIYREFLAWAKKNQLQLSTWGPMKGICPWLGVYRYCPKYEPWWGRYKGVEYNCPADRSFMKWYTRMVVALLRQGWSGWLQEELGPSPRTGLVCLADGHDHEPGDATYAFFHARRKFRRTLRKEFGPDFHLEGERPSMDAGIWDALDLDSLFTLTEMSTDIRYYSRIRHYYHFVPSYLDQTAVKPGSDDVDYLMLSALAVSNTHIYYGVARSQAERQRIRHWLDWARAHKSLMRRQSFFLPDWPGNGSCDSYLRLEDGRGFAFVFNANKEPAEALIPLDDSVGLNAKQTYEFKLIHPQQTSAVIPFQVKGQVKVGGVPSHTALLLSVEPAKD